MNVRFAVELLVYFKEQLPRAHVGRGLAQLRLQLEDGAVQASSRVLHAVKRHLQYERGRTEGNNTLKKGKLHSHIETAL
jgi:hypothetical protein